MNASNPNYELSHWARQLECSSMHNNHFRTQFIQIPGVSSLDFISHSWMFSFLLKFYHTPDSLAWYDIEEHYWFVGDTLYTGRRDRPYPSFQIRSVKGLIYLLVKPQYFSRKKEAIGFNT
ncbi:hypothetical protein OCU04_005501 [Sclerotinia nivalis]|uniref:Uncharacterized protein n=1 Tax=Sclerotinia nivalis TaxID=352851 RepID=A0A9X0APA0_9HELO|nr:hypothetical protein OCU04_005501 [Sclerotinia nivalis]